MSAGLALVMWMMLSAASAEENGPPVSGRSQECVECHEEVSPGIVGAWRASRHARVTPAEALKRPRLQRRMSAKSVPENLASVVVGCYECHSLRGDAHPGTFSHSGQPIHTVVSPADCQTCHPEEATQYAGSKKAHAVGNLKKNPVYHGLVDTVLGVQDAAGKLTKPSAETEASACFGCHGTTITVGELKPRRTRIGLNMNFPELGGWPNQGVGRINPDGSLGSCTSCHARHAFSLEMARKPDTCGQCHLAPDVPAYNVYKESKHGNLYASLGSHWNFDAVPWTVGEDVTAPTCATCHNSLLINPLGEVIAKRTHDFGARLWVRLFGLPYTHPQPKSGDTSIIRNSDGLPLPTTFTGQAAEGFLIDTAEQSRRRQLMTQVCQSCHSLGWVSTHFQRLDKTLAETDAMTRAATDLVLQAWAYGREDKTNPFDEPLEKMWVRQWLFCGNATRYATAMTGAYDYAAFKLGWWGLSENLAQMRGWLNPRRR